MRILPLALVGLTLLGGCSSGRDIYNRGVYGSGDRAGRGDRVDRSYPASAKTTEGGQVRYALCHRGRNTLTLPEAAVDAHLRHGDTFGGCSARDDRRRDDRRQDDRARDDRGRDDRGTTSGRGNGRGRGNR